ncbi:hypothetical protein GIV96_25525 [Pseudomonas syringae]|uniref:hypothetical protein n=2 Tax=Pseudomonas syringae TaxID=317 RepID=UPI00039D3C62|nr:hypothetical protein [Pseudomonas syringae]AZG89405.1 hypothetical protein N032_28045 [Pseudomonas syringae pv. pisi str. PP1]MCF5395309.1 hypothetical protein [Pseudomonas syringae]MCF5403339.1 hypothetical protein [Pseudomonas syringae]
MRLKMLKELYSAGVLSHATVEPTDSDGQTWKLVLHKTNSDCLSVSIAKRPEDKVYLRLNAALMDAHRVGFRNVEIRLPADFLHEDSKQNRR